MDTSLLIPGSLESIARAFFPLDENMRKLDSSEAYEQLERRDILEMQQEKIDRLCRYCQRDALLVCAIAKLFMERIFVRPFNGRVLPMKLPHSSADLAWRVWEHCFLQYSITTNDAAVVQERESYRGGLTLTYRT